MALRTVLLISLIVCSFMRVADAGIRPSVMFLSPDDSRFWQMVAGFMEQVAVDLDVDLEIQFDTDRHRFSYLRMAQQIITAEEKPDYLIIMCKELVTTQILEQAYGQGVKVFSFNTDVPETTRAAVGMPRETLDSWIGHVVPDNVEAGRTLAKLLERRAVERGLVEAGAPVPMVALTGTLDSSAARDRNQGLLNATSIGQAQLLQLVLAEWSEQQASEKMSVLFRRYPQTTAIWNASDGMALGAIQAARDAGRRPGEDVIVGGVDWEPRALAAIHRGDLTVSLGRHFMGGGLALLLIHDYHHGYDFAEGGRSAALSYQFEPATADNVHLIERMLAPEHWQALDFRQFSRALNPELREQDFSAEQLMDQFSSGLIQQGGGNPLVRQ
ncbi:ABC-type sugar transport system substrate-binding protein [Marinobacter sp. MBR-99]|uniref:ABC transporter substrate-binding protein n=1 Tax=Marinobacter sp. MBR-99 TaxID=3156461 RepID=UPI00339B7207